MNIDACALPDFLARTALWMSMSVCHSHATTTALAFRVRLTSLCATVLPDLRGINANEMSTNVFLGLANIRVSACIIWMRMRVCARLDMVATTVVSTLMNAALFHAKIVVSAWTTSAPTTVYVPLVSPETTVKMTWTSVRLLLAQMGASASPALIVSSVVVYQGMLELVVQRASTHVQSPALAMLRMQFVARLLLQTQIKSALASLATQAQTVDLLA
jgi:hypothetical protein